MGGSPPKRGPPKRGFGWKGRDVCVRWWVVGKNLVPYFCGPAPQRPEGTAIPTGCMPPAGHASRSAPLLASTPAREFSMGIHGPRQQVDADGLRRAWGRVWQFVDYSSADAIARLRRFALPPCAAKLSIHPTSTRPSAGVDSFVCAMFLLCVHSSRTRMMAGTWHPSSTPSASWRTTSTTTTSARRWPRAHRSSSLETRRPNTLYYVQNHENYPYISPSSVPPHHIVPDLGLPVRICIDLSEWLPHRVALVVEYLALGWVYHL